ncbi:hypothetical protein EROM_070230 [Encephalitozoon romaleae SJ-2008]|uniref:Uncharacterized protein n=1 Tax=Encephalitozoon romaleae (strain SJ-2008) TaxID=1178016 RepID=I7AND7_ENCRO|nr:hypothetical protein EROM_070230 [Encephalitozoon romaleae SJ-2008]AFN83274.1 hypothetical protein EROM_070230 [Encephalitozoon romaleae SJ-2008]
MRERSHPYSLLRKKFVKTMSKEKPKIDVWTAEDRQKNRLPTRGVNIDVKDVVEERPVNSSNPPIIGEKVLIKPYKGFSMDEFLSSVLEKERGLRFNFSLINSVILQFLDHGSIRSILSIESIFRAAKELPLVLISGYIYLEKYVKKAGIVFYDCKKLIKFFFGCCLIGSKFIYDTRHPDDLFFVGISPAEIFRIEGSILSAIDYDLEISNDDIRKVILQNKASLSNKEHLNAQFNRAIRTH